MTKIYLNGKENGTTDFMVISNEIVLQSGNINDEDLNYRLGELVVTYTVNDSVSVYRTEPTFSL
jgi:hypothetical protein